MREVEASFVRPDGSVNVQRLDPATCLDRAHAVLWGSGVEYVRCALYVDRQLAWEGGWTSALRIVQPRVSVEPSRPRSGRGAP